jgi:hypothetical protein
VSFYAATLLPLIPSPCFPLAASLIIERGEVCGSSRFACGGGSGGIDRIVGGSGSRDGEGCAIALEVKNRVLEETEVSFSVAPRTRNGHKVGGEFLFEVTKLLVVGFSRDARESPVGHLGPDGLGGDRIGHGADLGASTHGVVCNACR